MVAMDACWFFALESFTKSEIFLLYYLSIDEKFPANIRLILTPLGLFTVCLHSGHCIFFLLPPIPMVFRIYLSDDVFCKRSASTDTKSSHKEFHYISEFQVESQAPAPV